MKDILGSIGVRLGWNRYEYKISPGIYGVGKPDNDSPVLVTANYKLTIDTLRKELEGIDAWIIVIDTKGVNVWCAAGKGTFSTEEIIYRIKKVKLEKLVNHKNIILPQLGAPGVEAHRIYNYTGFKTIYGPIRATDIKAFLINNEVTDEMRRVTFDLKSRITVAFLEVVLSLRFVPFIYAFFMILQLIIKQHTTPLELLYYSFMNTLPYIGAIIAGTLVMPALLPVLPFRMFSLKGLVLGTAWGLLVIFNHDSFMYSNGWLVFAGHILLLSSITTFLSLNFTGSSTYTSLSGVLKETLLIVPIVVITSLLGMILLVMSLFF